MVGDFLMSELVMEDEHKTKEQLLAELRALRRQVADLEQVAAECCQAEMALRESETRHRLLLDSIRSPVLALQRDLTILYCNHEYAARAGCSTELAGLNALAVFPDFKGSKLYQTCLEVIRTGQAHQLEERRQENYLKSWVYPTPWGVLIITEDVSETKRIEQALWESQELLWALINANPFVVFLLDREGNILMANEALARSLGCGVNEVIGAPIYPWLPAELLAQGRQYAQEVMRTRRPAHFECTYQRRAVEVSIHPLVNLDGQVTRLAIFSQDITDRKQAEEARRMSEEQLHLLAQSTEDIIIIQDLAGEYLYYNGVPQYGLAVDEVVGKTPFDLFAPSLAAQMVADVRTVAERGETFTAERSIDWRGKHFKFIDRRYPIRDAQGQVVAVGTICRDVTEQYGTEAALRESENRFHAIFDCIGTGVVLTDLEGHLIQTNPALQRMLSYQADELIGLSLSALLHPQERESQWRQIEAGLRGERAELDEFEVRTLRQDGQVVWASLTVSVIRDINGGLRYGLGMIENISERKQTEAALLLQRRGLTLLSQAAQAFISTLDLDQVLAIVLEEVCRVLNVAASSIWLVEPTTGDLVCRQVTGPQSSVVRGWRLGRNQGLVGQVVYTGESLVVSDATTHPHHFRAINEKTGLELRSILSMPLRIKDAVIGVLQVVDTVANRFDAGDLALLEPLAASATIAIENGRLFEQAQRELGERRQAEEALRHQLAMEELVTTISTRFINLSPGEVDREIQRTLQVIGEFVRMDHSFVHLLTADGLQLERAYTWYAPDVPSSAVAELSNPAFEWSREQLRQGRILHISHLERLPPAAGPEKAAWQAQGIHGVLLIPLLLGKQWVGYLGVGALRPGRLWKPGDLALFKLVAEVLVNVLVRQRAVLALHENERFLQNIFDAIQDGISVLDRDMRLVRANRTMERWYPDLLPLEGQCCFEAYHGRAERCVACPAVQALEQGAMQRAVMPRGDPAGKRGWQEVYAFPLLDAAGQATGVVEYVRDITDRVQAEESLRVYASRLRLQHEIDRAILAAQSPREIAQAAVRRLRRVFPCRRVSLVEFAARSGAARVLATDADGETRFGTGLLIPRDVFRTGMLRQGRAEVVADVMSAAPPSALEVALRADGIQAYLNVPLVAQGDLIGLLNLGADSSDIFTQETIDVATEVAASLAVALRQARLYEQTLQDAQTKADLLKEVNHRVKNNLTAIVGLLYAEERYAPAEGRAYIEAAMGRLTQRIGGLLEVHNMLSQSEWGPLPLSDLVAQITAAALKVLSPDQQARVEIPPSMIEISPRQASNLALVIHELVTNTLKYAWNGRKAVYIQVDMALEGDTIRLEYRDDGPGYPEDVLTLRRYNVGIYLIRRLVTTSLRGTLQLANHNGAVTTLYIRTEERNLT